jgi:hypothetical protein
MKICCIRDETGLIFNLLLILSRDILRRCACLLGCGGSTSPIGIWGDWGTAMDSVRLCSFIPICQSFMTGGTYVCTQNSAGITQRRSWRPHPSRPFARGPAAVKRARLGAGTHPGWGSVHRSTDDSAANCKNPFPAHGRRVPVRSQHGIDGSPVIERRPKRRRSTREPDNCGDLPSPVDDKSAEETVTFTTASATIAPMTNNGVVCRPKETLYRQRTANHGTNDVVSRATCNVPNVTKRKCRWENVYIQTRVA